MVYRRPTAGAPRAVRAAAAMAVAGLVLVTGCSSGGGGGGTGPGARVASKQEVAAPVVTITPADGTGKALPEKGVQVTAANGTLDTVSVQLKGKDVPGQFSADKTSWKSDWTLTPNAAYQVSATAKNAQKTTTATSGFHTLKPTYTIGITSVFPTAGQKVGVGMPVTVQFDTSIPNTSKRAVEQALQVTSEQPNEGAWYWISDTEAIFRTKQYWGPNQKIAFTAHLAGVKVGRATYGIADQTVKFKVGDSHISTVNTRTHRMVVKINGRKVKDVGISAGRGGVRKYTTTSGIHLTMEAVSPVTMTSPGLKKGDPGYYTETVYDAVRISNSGEYVHSAPWSVGAQGSYNVSHGCVNASPAFATWFYNMEQWGDVVVVTGTDRPLEWNNGYGFWQMSWNDWVKGSAANASVSTGPAAADSSAGPSATASVTPTGTATP